MAFTQKLFISAFIAVAIGAKRTEQQAVCLEPGQCQGNTTAIFTLDLSSCMEQCYGSSDCFWWNYDPSDDLCQLLCSCVSVDESCQECLYGEKDCYEQAGNVDVLFISGGYDDEGDAVTGVELIPLDSPQTRCPAVPDFPQAEQFSHGFLHERQPVICAVYESHRCYRFNTTSWQWQDYISTRSTRDFAGGSFLKEDYILLGGFYGSDTTEIFSAENETWAYGPDIPYETWTPCATTFNDDQVFLTGGFNHEDKFKNTTAVLSTTDWSWSYLPDFTAPRGYHACGIARAADGTSSLVVAGGYYDLDGVRYDTEIYDLDSGSASWRKGVDFPSGRVEQASSVPYKKAFLVIGGTPDDLESLSSIWEYDPDNSAMPWILRPEELSTARQNGPLAILMKARDLDCTLSTE